MSESLPLLAIAGTPDSVSVPPSAREALTALRDRVDVASKALTAAKKAVVAALAAERSGDLAALEKARRRLEKASLAGIDSEPLRVAAADAVERHLERERARLRMTLVGALHQAAVEAGLELARLGAEPPTFELTPVTLELDFDREEARVLYAREVVTTTALEPAAVLEGRLVAMEAIRTHGLAASEAFELLGRAYRMVLAASGGREGDRVDLVDLLLPLSLLAADRDRWRQLEPGQLGTFTRFQLAYYLHRLRREGLLTHAGLRLDLGAATGGTTRDKRNVVFVPSGAGEGQYYLSLRLVPAGDGVEEETR